MNKLVLFIDSYHGRFHRMATVQCQLVMALLVFWICLGISTGYAAAEPLSTVTLSATPGTAVPVNTAITLTATPTGGTQVEYKFQIARPDLTGDWQCTTLQDYSTASTCQWTPTISERVTALVFVREAGSTQFLDYYPLDISVTAVDPDGGELPLQGGRGEELLEAGDHPDDSSTSLIMNPPSPQNAGTPVTLEAAVGVRDDIQYWFRVGYPKPDNTWEWYDLQSYAANHELGWTPAEARRYTIAVYTKELNCAAPRHGTYDDYKSAYYVTTAGLSLDKYFLA